VITRRPLRPRMTTLRCVPRCAQLARRRGNSRSVVSGSAACSTCLSHES
jgi:hypothetical protein